VIGDDKGVYARNLSEDAWRLAACNWGADCSASNSELRNVCIIQNICGASSLDDYLQRFRYSPADYQTIQRLANQITSSVATRNWAALGLASQGIGIVTGDRIFVNRSDGYSSVYGVTGTGNVNTPIETSAPVQSLYANNGSGDGGGGGCGGGGGYYQPTGNWQSYSASVGGVTVVGWEYVVTGVQWVPQNCN
jgi:hypothetical protein